MEYIDFKKRYNSEWFSASWVDITPENKEEITAMVIKKDVETLQKELEEIQEDIASIELKKLRLANLAKMYE